MRKINQKGSLVIFLTLGFALLGTFVGFALDFGRAYLEKARISRLVDGASLAAAKALKGQVGLENAATKAACDSMLMNGALVVLSGNSCVAASGGNITVAVSFLDKVVGGGAPIRFVQVQGSEPVSTTFLRFLGSMIPGDFSTINVNTMAEAGPERPIDLMLVLDRSGSMSNPSQVDGTGVTKKVALQNTVSTFLDNNFTVDDHIGMTSFAYRGCGGSSGTGDFTGGPCAGPDKSLGSSIASIKTAVNALVFNNGSTNTMEALQVANAQITTAIADPTRVATRKAILLITDGRPTSSRRTSTTLCNQDPITNASLGIASPPSSCVHSAFVSGSYNNMYWNAVPSSTFLTSQTIPGTQLYRDNVQYARQTAVAEANTIRNLGNKSVLVYVIAIGRVETSGSSAGTGSSLDDNAKCLLGRIANDLNTVNASCPNVANTGDGDTYQDLLPCKVSPTSCTDSTQQKGKMFTIDLNGNVQQQLDAVFNEVAMLLKLRLTI
jgi:hypothetical protein